MNLLFVPSVFVRTKRADGEEGSSEAAVATAADPSSDQPGTPVAPLEEENPATDDLSTGESTTSEAPTSLATTILDSVVETTTKEHRNTDDEGHWKTKLDLVEYLQGPVIVISIIVVVSLILLFLYVYKFRSNIRRQSVVNQI